MEVTRGRIHKPIKCLIYGPEGIGKSTLASKFPEAVFIDTEGSTSHMDVVRFPDPGTWTQLLDTVREAAGEPDDVCKTLVIDTADWAERLCIDHVLAVNKWSSIEAPGYGKGYVYIKEEFSKLLNLLSIVISKGKNVVLTAHSQMRKFEQPDELGAYDRWELKLSKQVAPLVKEWADMILFCNYKTMVINVDNKGAMKGKNKAQGGRRIMYTQHHPCWDAKNRFGLPEELDMDYEAIRSVVEPNENSTKTEKNVKKSTRNAQKAAENAPAPVVTAAPADEDPEVPEKSQAAETQPKESSMVSIYLSNPDHLPDQLKQLMETDGITEWEIEQVVFSRGYFPMDTPIEKMEQANPGFIEGWIIKFWPNVRQMALQVREDECVPFN